MDSLFIVVEYFQIKFKSTYSRECIENIVESTVV